ncbi:thyrostimulin alpha-2 subunit-like [Saccoglossus kowalevskii]|uniref:Glycoprotein hormone alpha-2-like protein n=1 Tax=Saccoglossus kowalevskii TaxID=10224 RepID=C6SUQ0_SACKO|nr:glycoprotein hormone alpha-2-like protein [Saccoglossus kowalevskii]CAR94705.2 TPA: putative glycoprotein hormone-alpha2 [Saccoglossus kowalevskii]
MKVQDIIGLLVILTLSVMIWSAEANNVPYWQRPGCHLVGYVKTVRVPGCHEEEVRMNACRGYCTSYSYLSSPATLEASGGTHIFTAKGSCCTIDETHNVAVTLQCQNGKVYRDVFKSAKSCVCGICDRD